MDQPVRRRRRKSRRTYNLVLTIIGLLCVLTIVFTISSIVNAIREETSNSGSSGGSLSGNSGSKDDDSSSGSNNGSNNGSSGSTDATDATDPAPVVDLDALLDDADFIASGYDYEKAISMLTAYPNYEDEDAITAKIALYEKLDNELVTYSSPHTVTHIFFHSLIADTDRAFDGDYDEGGYHTYMTTIDEFIAMMEEMYARGYVLITPYDLAYEITNEDGTTSFVYGDIRLPEGKTPFIMSQDDLNYYSYMISSGNGKNEIPYWVDEENDGFASRMVIGEDGYPTCEYVDADGNVLYGDYDLVPVLETFIQEHPDFSYHGARAVLGFTGYEGVLGYRTKPSYEAALNEMYANGEYPWDYATECQKASEVAQCLRDHGWILASHSYGHPRYGDISATKVEEDSDKWENTVQPIIGDCDVILYPNGSDIQGVSNYSFDNAKFAALYEDGYRYFFNVDSSPYWNQLGENYFRGGRRNLDGYRMYHHPQKLDDLFDVADVWDDARPTEAPRI